MLKFDLNFLWVIINLILFFVLMRLVLFKPIKKAMDKRQELIDSELSSARNANAEAEEKLKDYESRIAGYQSEGEQILSDARDSAKAEYDKILERADTDAEAIRETARAQMAAEAEDARKAAREEIASLAMQAAEKIVGANVSAATDSAIFDEFLQESSED